MSKFAAKVLYGRGLNVAAQINPSRKAVPQFTEIDQMAGVRIKKLGCGYLQSCYLLEDGRFVKAGYFMDTLTSVRIINMHRLVPYAIPLIQKLIFLGRLLSFRGGDQTPHLFNKDIDEPFEDVVFGGCRVFGLTKRGKVYGMGENYFAQLGTHNIINHEDNFTEIPPINKELIIGIGCGFQHTLFITNNNNLYACGKASDYQIQALRYRQKNQIVDKIQIPQLILKGEKVYKASGGLKFTLVWTEGDRLYAMGHNKFGQCGQNYLLYPDVVQLTQITFEWQKDERILDIACGFCHSLILTNKRVYFFGSIQQGQNPFSNFNENICTPTPLPIKNPVKIFADFDRSAIITESGEAYLFGGRDLSYCGGESGKLQVLQNLSIESEIGLGFGHTLIYV